ncbi:MAG: DHA2 family efflux MFS transporter permease subunit [Actinomycetota bacterium]|nr:DHA2 family efflux MFS transporter permease subunit [Actinomycetota bacterium]
MTLTEKLPPAGAEASPSSHDRRWWILGVLALAQLMVVLDATVVNIALPSAQRALGFSTADRQWVVTAYSLAFGALLLLGGRLADFFGKRRMLIVGMVGFALSSAVGGAATGFVMLAVARAVQGAFGALLAPAALAQLSTTFEDPAERGKAFGIYGAIAGAGGAVGLILGGGLTQYLDWRWCLYVNDVLAVFAVTGAALFLPRGQREHGIRLDWTGLASVGLGLAAIVYGFSEADTAGWSSPVTIALLVAGAILVTSFVLIERASDHPLLPLRVLADRNRGAANLVMLVSGIGMFGVFLFMTYYLQLVLGFSPIVSGIAFLPMIGVLVAFSAFGTAGLLPRFGPRWMVAIGMALAAAALVLFAQLRVSSTYAGGILAGLLVMGAGLGLVFGAAMNVSTTGAGADDAGVASALPNIGQQVGGSIGTALLNTLAASAAASYIGLHGHSRLVQAVASVRGDDLAFWVASGVFALGALLAATIFTRGPIAAPAGGHPAGMI